jgi:MFS family permease
VTGVLASFVIGVILDKYAKYKITLLFLAFGSVASVGASIFTLPTKSVILFSINIGLIGATIIPIIPVSYALAVELTYPIPEAMSNGMMVMLS